MLTQHKGTKKRPYQVKAVTSATTALSKGDRCTLVMACGSGKTLVGLWVAEDLECSTVLLLVPSIALVQQTLNEWRKNSSLPFRWLCCCSDKSVEDIVIEEGFAPTTDRSIVNKFMKGTGRKVLLCTYQSAALLNGLSFDLAILDEAHKTVGHQKKPFAFALEDNHITATKRLFLTATPKNIPEESHATHPFSMDLVKAYGPTAFTLSFSEAVSVGAVVDYQIIVCQVTKGEVEEFRKLRPVDVEHAVGVLAIKKALEAYPIKKAICFNSSVKAAKEFQELAEDIVDLSLHVNGSMIGSERGEILSRFKFADTAIVTNAKCLTEGVNIPIVDLVAFLSPKNSVVDIMQAAGRAMRPSPKTGKVRGYILIPVLVDAEDTGDDPVSQAAERLGFDKMLEVLKVLLDSDDTLAAICNDLRTELGESGKVGEETSSRRRRRVRLLGGTVDEDAFDITLAENLGTSWDTRFGELKKFVKTHKTWPSGEHTLSLWLTRNRSLFRDGLLVQSRVQRLSELGMIWDKRDEYLRDNIRKLQEYLKQHSNQYPPKSEGLLGHWVSNIRSRFKSKTLSAPAISVLETFGFQWSTVKKVPKASSLQKEEEREHRFACNCEDLRYFLKKNGRLPDEDKDFGSANRKLIAFVTMCVQRDKKGTLRSRHRDLLTKAGLVLEGKKTKYDLVWDKMFKKTESAVLSGNLGAASSPLNRWVRKQKFNERKGLLSKERLSALKKIGVL